MTVAIVADVEGDGASKTPVRLQMRRCVRLSSGKTAEIGCSLGVERRFSILFSSAAQLLSVAGMAKDELCQLWLEHRGATHHDINRF